MVRIMPIFNQGEIAEIDAKEKEKEKEQPVKNCANIECVQEIESQLQNIGFAKEIDINSLCVNNGNFESENDQSAKTDAGKPRLSLVPSQIIWDIAAVREYAVNGKYREPDNWRRVSPERYRDALYRHWLKYLADPKSVDEESGLPHLWHIATNVAFLCELDRRV